MAFHIIVTLISLSFLHVELYIFHSTCSNIHSCHSQNSWDMELLNLDVYSISCMWQLSRGLMLLDYRPSMGHSKDISLGNLHSHAAWLSKIIFLHAGNIRKFRHLMSEFHSSSSGSCKCLQSITFFRWLPILPFLRDGFCSSSPGLTIIAVDVSVQWRVFTLNVHNNGSRNKVQKRKLAPMAMSVWMLVSFCRLHIGQWTQKCL